MPAQEAQLEWEARAGRFAALGAFIAALAPVVSAIALNAQLPERIKNDVDQVNAIAKHSGAFAVSTGIASVGWFAFILPLGYLMWTSRARIDVPRRYDPLILIGPVLLAIALIAGLIDIVGRAQDALPVANAAEAKRVLRGSSEVVRGIGAAGSIAIGAAFIVASMYAFRAGLLSRFMSVLGAIIGALTVFGSLVGASSIGGPIVLFWGIALGMLFLGRWPGGRGPAWGVVEPIPWPTAAERQAAIQAAREAEEVSEAREAEDVPEAPAEPTPDPNPRAARKRKKKKARR